MKLKVKLKERQTKPDGTQKIIFETTAINESDKFFADHVGKRNYTIEIEEE